MMTERRIGSAPADAPRREVPLWAAALLSLAAALVGLLPWLVTGARLPEQELWTRPVPAGDMPIALLPFSRYALTQIFALLIVGTAVTGVVARGLRTRLSRRGLAVMLGTAPLVQAIAIAQAALVTNAGLPAGAEAAGYVTGLVGASLLSLLIGGFAGALIALSPRAGAVIGLTLAAIAAPSWLSALFLPSALYGYGWSLPVLSFLPLVTSLLTGIAIAWAGIETAGRIGGALASLALLWIVPAAVTAIAAAGGSRVLAEDPAAMTEYALQVFAAALFSPAVAPRLVLVAAIVASLGSAVRWAIEIHRPDPTDS